MRIAALLLFLLLPATLLPAVLRAQEAPPAEQLILPPLQNFKPVYQDNGKDKRVVELVPSNQTLETWSERVAIIVYVGVTGKSPKTVAETLQAEWRKDCGKFDSHPVEQQFEKSYPTSIFAMQCIDGKSAGRQPNEFLMAKIIQGIDNLYLVQHAWRGEKDKLPPPLRDEKAGEEWANFVRSVELCDSRLRGQPCGAGLRR
ncbi:hypothetical protein [Ferrovibrio sp.]|uniref:hypothetical protein n=1 Tax=Ferrovibrio sp. TaxID=1917215 RepID=UPI003D0B38A5